MSPLRYLEELRKRAKETSRRAVVMNHQIHSLDRMRDAAHLAMMSLRRVGGLAT